MTRLYRRAGDSRGAPIIVKPAMRCAVNRHEPCLSDAIGARSTSLAGSTRCISTARRRAEAARSGFLEARQSEDFLESETVVCTLDPAACSA